MKYILLFIILISQVDIASSQNYYGKSIDITAGYTQDGFGIEAGYNYKFNETERVSINILTTFSEQDVERFRLAYNIYKLKGSYFWEVYSSRREGVNINFGGGLLGGYEDIMLKEDDDLNEVELKQSSQFIFGASLAAEIDLFITRSSSMVFKVSEEYHVNSDLGKFIPYISIGYRYEL